MARRSLKRNAMSSSAAKRVVISSRPKFLLGHASIPTTEQYLGAEQDFHLCREWQLGIGKVKGFPSMKVKSKTATTGHFAISMCGIMPSEDFTRWLLVISP